MSNTWEEEVRLGFDLDGVLAQFTDKYARLLSNETGLQFPKASEEWPSTWFWERDAGVTPEQEKLVWNRDILASGKHFWHHLKPMEGAGGVVRRLNELTRLGHEVFFLTHRFGHKAKLQTEQWLYERGMFMPTVLLSEHKVELIQALNIEFFIDDKPSTVRSVAMVLPKVYLMNAPYNRVEVMPPQVVRVKNVEEALRMEGLWG